MFTRHGRMHFYKQKLFIIIINEIKVIAQKNE